MPHLRVLAGPLAVMLLATTAATAAPAEMAPAASPGGLPPAVQVDAPSAPKPTPPASKGLAPPSDAIPGAQSVVPPSDCPKGTLRAALGDLVCR